MAGRTTPTSSTAGEDAVADRVRRQVENGIDVVTDGEMSKVSFLGYVKDRLGGFEPDMETTRMAPSWQKEVDDFPEYYASTSRSTRPSPLRRIICRGPISYVGQGWCRPTSTTCGRPSSHTT